MLFLCAWDLNILSDSLMISFKPMVRQLDAVSCFLTDGEVYYVDHSTFTLILKVISVRLVTSKMLFLFKTFIIDEFLHSLVL